MNFLDKQYARIGIFIMLLIIIFYSLFSIFSQPLRVETVPVKFVVWDRIGVDLNNSEINFGAVFPGSGATQHIILDNSYNFDVSVRAYVTREIKDYIFVAEQPIIIPAHTEKKIGVGLATPPDIPIGNYSGEIRFEFWKVK